MVVAVVAVAVAVVLVVVLPPSSTEVPLLPLFSLSPRRAHGFIMGMGRAMVLIWLVDLDINGFVDVWR